MMRASPAVAALLLVALSLPGCGKDPAPFAPVVMLDAGTFCVPRTRGCDGETPGVCRDDGSAYDPIAERCDTGAGLHCSPAGCSNLCLEAERERSYIGCEYLATSTSNSPLAAELSFAVAIANPQLVPAHVTITRGSEVVRMLTVAPNALATEKLPPIEALIRESASPRSRRVLNGAYVIRSDVPVTAYQFNPLEYVIARDCAEEMGRDGRCFSFTSDASLLLPAHALTGSYLVLSRAGQLLRLREGAQENVVMSPGFLTVIATVDDTSVEILAQGATTASSPSAVTPVAALAAGERATFTLARGETLQLTSAVPASCPVESFEETFNGTMLSYCPLGPAYDLTGTEIRASAPVAVFAGHNCAFVPYNRWACDHLEEAMFPVESWGKEVAVALTRPLREEPNLVRILSSADDNTITIDPPLVPARTLARGAYFEIETHQDIVISATQPISVAQTMVGQNFAGLGTVGNESPGDPSMAVGIPREQFRTNYTFLAPETYPESWISVVTPLDGVLTLDGRELGPAARIGASGLGTLTVMIRGGTHRITGTRPFGLIVYGFGTYTSYLYPGGLDYREIAPPI